MHVWKVSEAGLIYNVLVFIIGMTAMIKFVFESLTKTKEMKNNLCVIFPQYDLVQNC